MKLAGAEVVPYALPFRRPYVTARGSLTRREMVLLRLRDAEGHLGLGEAVPLSLRGGTALAEVVRELEAATAGAAGTEELAARAGDGALSAPSQCALRTALADLEARAAGGSDSEKPRYARCNATLVAGEPAAVAADAERWAAAGFASFKLKLGAGRLEDDIEQVRAVRAVLDPMARIRVDANAAWSVEQARRVIEAIEPCDVELVEQPVATLAEMARVTAASPIPIAADESVESVADAERAKELGACDLVGVKLSKVGGVAAAEGIAAVLPTFLSSALDGPVGIAAAVELASRGEAHRPFDEPLAHGLATQLLFAETIAAVGCQLFDDVLQMPRGPGLGVEIDDDSLQAHRL